ncbi:MAG: EAL domain-containing protein [Silicimonas sp.]|nr:EAL domain-containing protein [Silicimonas sp.]
MHKDVIALSRVLVSIRVMVVAIAALSAVLARALMEFSASVGFDWRSLALTATSGGCIALLLLHRRTIAVLRRRRSVAAPWAASLSFDPMTGIANATRFQDKVTVTMTAGCDAAIIFVDIAGTREVNTRRGRAFADALIKELAHRIRAMAEEAGGFAARVGGDRFGVLLPRVRGGELADFCERLSAICAAPVSKGGETLTPRVWIGAVDISQLNDSERIGYDDILRMGKFTLFAARSSGQLFRVYDTSLEAKYVDRDAMVEELPGALRNRELEVFLQPRVNLDDGTIFGFEALVRWSRGGDYVPAVDLVATAEETGQVIDLDRYMMDRAIEIVADWNRRRKTAFSLSVNMSALHLRRESGADFVADCLRRHKMPPELLTVEITETVSLESAHGCCPSLIRLKEFGCKVAIDDFGSGYASLSHLRDLPADQINIERSLVDRTDQSEEARIILTAVLGLAERLGLEVLIGGIERQSQARLLSELGCRKGQGYLFGHPRPALDWLEDVTYSNMPNAPAA